MKTYKMTKQGITKMIPENLLSEYEQLGWQRTKSLGLKKNPEEEQNK